MLLIEDSLIITLQIEVDQVEAQFLIEECQIEVQFLIEECQVEADQAEAQTLIEEHWVEVFQGEVSHPGEEDQEEHPDMDKDLKQYQQGTRGVNLPTQIRIWQIPIRICQIRTLICLQIQVVPDTQGHLEDQVDLEVRADWDARAHWDQMDHQQARQHAMVLIPQS